MPLTRVPTPSTQVETRADARREHLVLTESLLGRLARSRSVTERRRLQHEVVLLNLPLADGVARRYAGRGIEWDDLVQVGRVGLLKAVVGYQAGKGAGFPAYATPTIAGEIKRYFRDHAWMVRPPRRLQELHAEVSCIEPNLRQQLNRAPSAGELAGALGVETEELTDVLVARSGYSALSLDAPTYTDSGLSLGEGLPDDNDGYAAVELAEWLRPALARLSERERRIIALRFVDGLSQEQIGRHLGVSQMHISRLLAGILGRLRDDLGITDAQATA